MTFQEYLKHLSIIIDITLNKSIFISYFSKEIKIQENKI